MFFTNVMAMKKVLIITYYWPPAGGPGVQRWLKFVKYLPDFNIAPVVYIPENPTYPILDTHFVSNIPDHVTIIKQKIKEPYRWASLFSKNKTKTMSSGIIPTAKKQSFIDRFFLWIRGNLFIPDARVFWVRPSIKYLASYIQTHGIDTLITTGPPHSLHLIGLGLKKQVKITWVADFRDPWTTIGYHKELKLSHFAQQKHKNLEREVLQKANHIIVTSKTTQKTFAKYTSQPITVITNGYDPENVAKLPLDSTFSLAHIGSFLSKRNPEILWTCLQELVAEIPDFKKHLNIKLIGSVSETIVETIAHFGLTPYVCHMGYMSHHEAIQQQQCSQILLLIEIDSKATRSIIPGKLFEYMTSGRPIIGIGPEASDFESILQETNTGMFVTYSQKNKLKQMLIEYYHLFLAHKLQSHPVGLQQYSRKKLTEKLAGILS